MRRFLYYFPGLPGMNPGMLSARGLLSRFSGYGGNLMEHIVMGVPDGPAGSGCIVAAGSRPPTYAPDRQHWMEGAACWVAAEDSELMPRAEDLAHEVGIVGYDLVLGDGGQWRVPLLRRWDAEKLDHVSTLPASLASGPDGKLVRQVGPKYASLDRLAVRLVGSFIKQLTIPSELLFVDAVELLSANYRVGAEEVGLLGLLDEEKAVAVLAAAIDYPRLQAQAAEMAMAGLHAPVILDEGEE